MSNLTLNIGKILLPAAIFAVLYACAQLIAANPPETKRRTGGETALIVETTTLEQRDYQIMLESYGTVQPRTRSQLVSQVSGLIIDINPSFREGGFFKRGEMLVQLDPRDYEADVKIAQAALMDARQALAEAQARSTQAAEDWERLGNAGEPSALVLREPQLTAARSRVASAEASVTKAKLDLSRTRVTAPYDGRVLQQSVDVGQVVNNLAALGEIYATDLVEVRLPLRNRDLEFIDLPAEFEQSDTTKGARVVFTSDLGGPHSWRGELVRTEAAIDDTARQLHVAARIDSPFESDNNSGAALKVGQYVTARIAGRSVADALIVANENIYQGTFVFVVNEGVLERRRVQIAWQNDIESIVADGLFAGEHIVTTQLGQVTTGTRVKVTGAAARDQREARPASPPGSAAQ
ncbi:MAG: efflux RND transporter periplasmic adaptor subunit [Pseudomonadota bacterium]